ncbi:MAG TPA: glycosyltransferase [Rhodothermales bacterium]
MLLAGICLLLTAIQVAYWIALDRGFRNALRTSLRLISGPIRDMPSVVVAARNEASAIPALVRALGNQTLRPEEVLLVDDGSSDGTAAIAEREAEASGISLRALRREDDGGRKKSALTAGITAARSDAIALTDGDCVPERGWLEGIARAHGAANGRAHVVVGYSPYVPRPGVLNRLARYETLVAGFLAAAAAGLDRGYMGVGRNLSYRRQTFTAIGGFAHASAIRSGDDDLLVQEVVRRDAAEVVALLESETFVRTEAPSTWRAWFRQKRRHIAASRYYDWRTSVHLTLLNGTGLLAWVFPLILGWTGVVLLGLRLLAQFVVLHRASARLGDRDLLAWFPVLEGVWAGVGAVLAVLAVVAPAKRW